MTRADLADPGPATAQARAEIAATSLGAVPAVAVSGVTGAGLPQLRAALDRLAARLPAPAVGRPGPAVGGPRLHRAGQRHRRHRHPRRRHGCAWATNWSSPAAGEPVRVRGLHSLGEARPEVAAVARVAVNLRGTPRDRLGRGDALLTPGRFHRTDLVDVRLAGDPAADLPATLTLHVGSAAVPVRVRPLGPDTVRLRLARPLPLLVG